MTTAILKKTAIFVVPAMILFAAWFVLPRLDSLPPARRELVEVAPYLTAALGMFLCVHFHRGRPFFVLLLLSLFCWSCRTYLGDGTTGIVAQGTFQAFALFLPLNITIISFLRERGILTMAGRLRLAFLAAEVLAVAWIFQHRYVDIQPWVTRKFFLLPALDTLAIPQPALALTTTGFVLICLRAARRQSPIDSGFLGALVALFIACNWLTTHDVPAVFSAAAAIIVTLSVLQDSYNMAFRDDLTTLPSRRALNESLLGLGRNYTIAMVDVDHFKKFNDTYGHDVGDQVLKMVGKKMRGVAGGGKSFRYGGEEFTVLFPRRRMADTLPHLEELRKEIADYRLFIRSTDRPKEGKTGKGGRGAGGNGTFVSVTISIGVAESGDGLATSANVIREADKALYRAKNKGRNQVCK